MEPTKENESPLIGASAGTLTHPPDRRGFNNNEWQYCALSSMPIGRFWVYFARLQTHDSHRHPHSSRARLLGSSLLWPCPLCRRSLCFFQPLHPFARKSDSAPPLLAPIRIRSSPQASNFDCTRHHQHYSAHMHVSAAPTIDIVCQIVLIKVAKTEFRSSTYKDDQTLLRRTLNCCCSRVFPASALRDKSADYLPLLPKFVFPAGAKLQAQWPEPSFHSFVITRVDATRLFGFCTVFYRLATGRLDTARAKTNAQSMFAIANERKQALKTGKRAKQQQ